MNALELITGPVQGFAEQTTWLTPWLKSLLIILSEILIKRFILR